MGSRAAAAPYGRTSLYLADGLEAVLIHLPAGAETYIHDHGASFGCAQVLEGRMINRMFRLDDYGYPEYTGESEVKQGNSSWRPGIKFTRWRIRGRRG
ncbi:hypothetical protein LJK87_27275 [Paenibacillus sp. P25]|nr:hypothetical protein LJK87_27275 [Paenibacillus sp. P25]